MEMYKLGSSEYDNSEWEALFVTQEEKKTGLIEAMNNNTAFESKELIKMLYKNIYDDPSEVPLPLVCD